MTTTSDQDTFRTVDAGAGTLSVQTRPVSVEFALAHADANGLYTGIVAAEPHFYDEAVEQYDSLDSLTDDLVGRLVEDLPPHSAAEDIVGFDYDNNLVLIRVSTDVATAIAERDADLAAE